jgi:hypothetical protein
LHLSKFGPRGYSWPRGRCGGMADAIDSKSIAQKAWGFDSLHRHHPPSLKLPPTRKSASADWTPAIARGASDGGSAGKAFTWRVSAEALAKADRSRSREGCRAVARRAKADRSNFLRRFGSASQPRSQRSEAAKAVAPEPVRAKAGSDDSSLGFVLLWPSFTPLGFVPPTRRSISRSVAAGGSTAHDQLYSNA